MGRRKLEIKRIEDKSTQQVTFCKRRNGLIEKARQLSILCDSSVALLMISATGKLYSSSSGESMARILRRYETQYADEPESLDLEEKTRNYLSHEELLDIVQCKLQVANADNTSLESLTSLEEQLKSALSVTKARKAELMMEYVRNLQEKEKLLREENQILASQLTKMKEKRFPENSSGKNPPETLPLFK